MKQIMIDIIFSMVKMANVMVLPTRDVNMQNIFGISEDDFKLENDSLIVLTDKLLKTMMDIVLVSGQTHLKNSVTS